MAVAFTRRGTGGTCTFETSLPPQPVYDYLADFQRHREWLDGEMLQQEQTSPGPVAEGTTFRTIESPKPGSKMTAETYCEVTELQPPRRIAWSARTKASTGMMAMRSHWAFDIAPAGTGSRVTQTWRFDPPNTSSRIFLNVFVPIVDLLGGMGASPKSVKRHAEQLERVLAAKAQPAG